LYIENNRDEQSKSITCLLFIIKRKNIKGFKQIVVIPKCEPFKQLPKVRQILNHKTNGQATKILLLIIKDEAEKKW